MVWPWPCPISDLPPTHPSLTLLIKHDLDAPVYILLPSTRPNSCNGHRKVSNALPEPDRSRPHLGSYTSAVPNQTRPLLLRLAQSCSLRFSFPVQWCAQPPNSRCTVAKIFLTSEPSLFHSDQRGELVVTPVVTVGNDIRWYQRKRTKDKKIVHLPMVTWTAATGGMLTLRAGLLWVVAIDRAGAGGGNHHNRSSEHAGEEKKSSLGMHIECVGTMVVVASCGCEGRGDGPHCCCHHQDTAGNKVSVCPSNPKLPNSHCTWGSQKGPRSKWMHWTCACTRRVLQRSSSGKLLQSDIVI